ncbi:GAD-like domain-containing protein [Pseudomonas sp.]|uniref:GAD-like domain-containing protein n=1 Tax=Pseudomonas sp. TaxID=306 RepID=UPI00289C0352|nr:GAD-like domain-containing protein [Pseudomonas sp.]
MIDNLGEATSRREVPAASIDKYQSKLPPALLGYWREEGWCSYADGLFWIVDPDAYKATLDMWLQGSGLTEIDNYHVIARDAFGSLYAWGERYQRKITVSSLAGGIVALKNQLRKSNPQPDRSLGIFLGSTSRDSLDFDDNQGRPLFQRALAKLGPVAEDEMYAFEPALCIGGKADLEHMVKLNLEVHLMILDQLRR